MAFQNKLTRAETLRLINDVARGMLKKDAAVKYGVSVSTVSRICNNENRGKSLRRLSPCGSIGAYRRHLRNKEVPCDKCNSENNRYERERT